MALGALFSAMEVVPLTLLTLDASDFVKLTRGRVRHLREEDLLPYKWAFYFLMAVGVWNFVGAGIFGFLINLPIVSYFEVGTILTPNHGHAAMMGVFGLLGVAFMVFAMRRVLQDEPVGEGREVRGRLLLGTQHRPCPHGDPQPFPRGGPSVVGRPHERVLAREGPEFLNLRRTTMLEWLRMPADVIFIVFGVIPLLIAAGKTYWLSNMTAMNREGR